MKAVSAVSATDRKRRCPEAVTPPTVKKKKKKKEEERLRDAAVAMETREAEHREEEPGAVTMVTAFTRTKKKKKKKEEERLGDAAVAVDTREAEHREEEPGAVMMVTAFTRNKKKKQKKMVTMETKVRKKKKKDSVSIGTSEMEKMEQVTKETRKKKKKKCNAIKVTVTMETVEDTQLHQSPLDELKEFIPDVELKSQDQIQRLLRYDLERFKVFKRQGVALRRGRFSQEENQRIIANVSDFLALTGISSANQLLCPQRFKGQEAELRKLRAQHHFLVRIAEGIPRSVLVVNTRAKKIFDDSNHMGRFSKEELHSLVKLHRLHGNDWRTIAQKMDRSIYALQKRFVCLATGRGFWEAEEEQRLLQAVRAHLEGLVEPGSALSRTQLCVNLPWKDISHQVQTRSWTQCRIKWFCILKARLSAGRSVFNRGREGLQAKILLIHTLYNMGVDDAADIDWEKVAQSIGDVTPMCVQKTFYRLKVFKVPNWSRLSYGEIVDFLQEHVVPQLQNRLSMCSTNRAKPGAEGAEPDEELYQLNDIFNLQDVEIDNT